MRRTVIFHEDVAQAIEPLQRERTAGVNEVVNDLIRRGLEHVDQPRRRFEQRTSAMKARTDVTKVEDVLETVGGPKRSEICSPTGFEATPSPGKRDTLT